MTYRDILKKLKQIPQHKIDDDACILLTDSDEIVPITTLIAIWDYNRQGEYETKCIDSIDGVLDEEHPFFTAEF